MRHGRAAAEEVNHEALRASPGLHTPEHHGDIHDAMGRIADIVVANGEGLTLESLIKAFWRSYSASQGNVVSIHEARGGTPGPVAAEDAFARMPGRIDRMAQSLGLLGDRVDRNEERFVREAARAARAYRDELDLATACLPVHRRHADGLGDARPDAPAIETSLPNRAQFEVALRENFRIARNEVEPLSVAICSVSRIDQIVENHGLHTATRLMERVASTLSLATRGECYSARKTASEFIMLARGITITQFQAILEQSIVDLSARRWQDRFSNKTLGMVEMHVGIAHVFDFANPAEAMRAADFAHGRAMLEPAGTVVLADACDLDED
ncbi:diguanylate cyclase domain-containing protein [Alteriqipengyuania sp. 357]